jgi:acetoin utilization deacetylase AcuC-like enzyme
LETTHCPDYIQRFLRGDQTELEQRNVGFPWSQQGVDRALSSVGGTLAAACDVCEIWGLQQKHGIPPWAAHIAGGTHHAFYDRGEGFSVFSDIAVAANIVLQRYPHVVQKILIVDLDVHQGNGNAVLFANNTQVDTFSIQCEGNYFSEKQQSDLDVELPVHCTDQTYLATLNHWLKIIGQEGGPYDLVFFQAGVDIIEHDRLGRMLISPEGVRRRNELVYHFAASKNVPLVISMGGGYPKNDDWAPIINAHANVYLQAHEFLRERRR